MTERIAVATGSEAERIVEQVRARYGRIAEGQTPSCCGPSQSIGYSPEELAGAEEGDLGLGCGAPIGALRPLPGETVLDLGSGAGLDAFLAARHVGPAGRVIGVDMTPEMLERARRGATRLGLAQVEFREGRLEALPVADASVDAVTSNCVINLVPDKGRVFAEVARVLRPGGRLVVSDIVLDGRLPESVAKDIYAYVGCIAGAQPREEYFGLVAKAGLAGVEILKDVDYLAVLERSVPKDLQALLDRLGVERREILGKVRSVTFRAYKP